MNDMPETEPRRWPRSMAPKKRFIAPLPAPKPPRVFGRQETLRLIDSVALAAPAVQLLVVEAWCESGVASHEVHPVVAVQSTLVSEYARVVTTGRPDRRTADPAKLEAAGWDFVGTFAETAPLIVDQSTGRLMDATSCLEAPNVAWATVACPWDPSEDTERLAFAIDQAERAAVRKASQNGYGAKPTDDASARPEPVLSPSPVEV